MVEIEEKNIKGLISTLKGIIPANYDSMDRLVACVQYLDALLTENKNKGVTDDG